MVVLTGTDDQALAMQAVHEGAQDFLVKRRADREQLLARAIRYAIERKRSRGARRAPRRARRARPISRTACSCSTA